MSQSTTSEAYIPGVCNINRAEIASRKKAGYFGIALFVIVAVALYALTAVRLTRLLLFIPAFIAAIGFLQAKHKFCVSYAASGLQNAADDASDVTKVIDQTAHATDKKRARRLNTQAGLIAICITVLAVLLPAR
jgi:hypothetical protein